MLPGLPRANVGSCYVARSEDRDLRLLVNCRSIDLRAPAMDAESKPKQSSDLPSDIGAPARRALLAAGLARIELIADVSEADLRRLHGVGPKAIERLRGALAAQGRSFRE
jgi:hypothetical protein